METMQRMRSMFLKKHCKICVILLAAEAKIFQKSTHRWQECVEHCKLCLIVLLNVGLVICYQVKL